MEITIESIEELTTRISLSHDAWRDAHFGDIAFRGQARSSWVLNPKAFREGEPLGFGSSPPRAPEAEVTSQGLAEYRAVRSFVDKADEIGLAVPGDLHQFRMIDDLPAPERAEFFEHTWPHPNHLELLALAQHHGAPTRLLDLTYHSLIALYLAAEEVVKTKGVDQEKEFFAVWALDLRFIKKIWSMDSVNERVRIVEASRASNDFLRAQYGLFITDAHANQFWHNGKPESLEAILANRVSYWRERPGLWGKDDLSDAYVLPWMKFNVPNRVAPDAIRYAHQHGIDWATVRPSHDQVVPSLKFAGNDDAGT